MVQLGDASIASPFTSRSNSVFPVTYILQQGSFSFFLSLPLSLSLLLLLFLIHLFTGRCTLVTTYQIFRILAVNCLVTAYSLSVLYLDGIKLGDTQATVAGLVRKATTKKKLKENKNFPQKTHPSSSPSPPPGCRHLLLIFISNKPFRTIIRSKTPL